MCACVCLLPRLSITTVSCKLLVAYMYNYQIIEHIEYETASIHKILMDCSKIHMTHNVMLFCHRQR